jgi:hypothetical protein
VKEIVGPVEYRVAWLPELAGVHDVFHVSTLRKYVHDPSLIISFKPLQILDNLSYEEIPIQMLDQKSHPLRTKTIPL